MFTYRKLNEPDTHEERVAKRLADPQFRLEALEYRIAHIEEYLQRVFGETLLIEQFRPLKNEDLL